MDVRAALKGQYRAALAMFRQAVDACSDTLWVDGSEAVAFWRVTYHTLFFTHFYLGPDVDSFRRWEHHRKDHESLGPVHYPPHHEPELGEPYTKAQMLDYLAFCTEMVDEAVDGHDLDATQCGFPWYQIPKLDHQINNIRHIQHHTATLAARLRAAGEADVDWVGFE